MALDFAEEVLPLRILRLLVVVGEGDVETVQHSQDLAIVSKLVTCVSGVHPRTRKDQHTERPAFGANRPIQSPQAGLQLANPIFD